MARFDERDPELLLAIGEHQLALERWEDARASFERALSLEEGSRARAGLRRALDALAPRAATGEDAGKSDG